MLGTLSGSGGSAEDSSSERQSPESDESSHQTPSRLNSTREKLFALLPGRLKDKFANVDVFNSNNNSRHGPSQSQWKSRHLKPFTIDEDTITQSHSDTNGNARNIFTEVNRALKESTSETWQKVRETAAVKRTIPVVTGVVARGFAAFNNAAASIRSPSDPVRNYRIGVFTRKSVTPVITDVASPGQVPFSPYKGQSQRGEAIRVAHRPTTTRQKRNPLLVKQQQQQQQQHQEHQEQNQKELLEALRKSSHQGQQQIKLPSSSQNYVNWVIGGQKKEINSRPVLQTSPQRTVTKQNIQVVHSPTTKTNIVPTTTRPEISQGDSSRVSTPVSSASPRNNVANFGSYSFGVGDTTPALKEDVSSMRMSITQTKTAEKVNSFQNFTANAAALSDRLSQQPRHEVYRMSSNDRVQSPIENRTSKQTTALTKNVGNSSADNHTARINNMAMANQSFPTRSVNSPPVGEVPISYFQRKGELQMPTSSPQPPISSSHERLPASKPLSPTPDVPYRAGATQSAVFTSATVAAVPSDATRSYPGDAEHGDFPLRVQLPAEKSTTVKTPLNPNQYGPPSRAGIDPPNRAVESDKSALPPTNGSPVRMSRPEVDSSSWVVPHSSQQTASVTAVRSTQEEMPPAPLNMSPLKRVVHRRSISLSDADGEAAANQSSAFPRRRDGSLQKRH